MIEPRSLRVESRTNTVAREALDAAVPDYRGLLATHDRLVQAHNRASTNQMGADEAIERVRVDLLDKARASEVDLDRLNADLAAVLRAHEVSLAAKVALNDVANRADQAIDEAIRQSLGKVFAWVDRESRAVVSAARELPLRGARTAQAAIDLGTADAWQEQLTLRRRWFELRLTHLKLLGSPTEGHLDNALSFGVLSNYAECDPDWYTVRRGVRSQDANWSLANGYSKVREPWLTFDNEQRWLAIITDHELKVWAPTESQIAEVVQLERARALEREEPRETLPGPRPGSGLRPNQIAALRASTGG